MVNWDHFWSSFMGGGQTSIPDDGYWLHVLMSGGCWAVTLALIGGLLWFSAKAIRASFAWQAMQIRRRTRQSHDQVDDVFSHATRQMSAIARQTDWLAELDRLVARPTIIELPANELSRWPVKKEQAAGGVVMGRHYDTKSLDEWTDHDLTTQLENCLEGILIIEAEAARLKSEAIRRGIYEIPKQT